MQQNDTGSVILFNDFGEPVYFLNEDAVTFSKNYSPNHSNAMDITSVNNQRTIVFSGKAGSKLSLVYYVPENSFMENIRKTFFNMYAVTGIFIVIGVGLSLYFSGASYRPVKRIMKAISAYKPPAVQSKKEVEFIENFMYNIALNERNHHIARKKYNKASFDLMLSKYLYGRKKHPNLTELFSVYNLTFSFRKYFVALISINDIDDNTWDFGSANEYELIESAISNVIDELIGDDYQSIYVYLYENILFCLTGTDVMDEELIKNTAKAAFLDATGFALKNLYIDFTVYISGIFTGLDDIRNRYNETYDFYNASHGITDTVTFCNQSVDDLTSRGVSDKAEELVNDVAAFIEQHYADDDLNVNAIGLHFKLSPYYLSSLFKLKRGEMLRNYISEVRMKNAEKLLSLNVNIDEVAQRCGFSNTRSFRRAFNRYYGISPSEYKKNH